MSPVPVLAAALITAGGILSPFVEPGSREARRGAELYEEGDWVGAAEHFQKAHAEDPDPVLRYNLGAAVYQGQNFPEAVEAFGTAVPSEEVTGNQIAYNLGNALYRNQNLEGALEAYRQALREDPEDADARFNYELVLRQMQSQEQNQDQQQEDPQQQQENQNQDSQSPPDSSQTGDQEQQQQQQDQQPQQPQGQEDQEPQDQEQQQAQNQESGEENQDQQQQAQPVEEQFLQPEDAARLLDAVTPEERELIRARFKSAQRRRVEKDW